MLFSWISHNTFTRHMMYVIIILLIGITIFLKANYIIPEHKKYMYNRYCLFMVNV